MIESNFSEGYAAIDRALSALAGSSEIIYKAAVVGQAAVRRRISTTKATPDEAAWGPWMPGTTKSRARRGTAGSGLLFDSGRLFDSVQVVASDSHSATIAPGTEYAKFLDAGTRNMPSRQFMGWSMEDENTVSAVFAAWVDRSWS